MQNRSDSSRSAIYFMLILVLAIGLRFAHLGGSPLSDFEAQAALGALDWSHGFAAQPAYVLLTRLLFQLFGSGEFLARLWPAVFGSALVLLPLAWRSRLGEKATLLLSLFLALDPGLVALSRLASGIMLAISAALWAFTAWQANKPAAAGFLAALAVLAAPGIYVGLFAALLTWAILQPKVKLSQVALRSAGLAFLVTLLLGGSALLSYPRGLSGIAEVFVAFFAGQGQASAGLGEFLFALLGYGLPAVVFGGIGAQRAWRSDQPWKRALAVFAASALLIALVNPQRQVADLAWTLLPLWALAALWIAGYIKQPTEERAAAYGEALLMGLLSIFFVMTVARLSQEGPMITFAPGSVFPIMDARAIMVAFVVGIAVLASVLIALGWSSSATLQGLVWSLTLVTLLAMLSASTRFMRGPAETANDLWSPGPSAGQVQPLLDTLADISFWDGGQKQALPIQLLADTPSLQWAVRQYPRVDSGVEAPLAAITGEGADLTAFAEYQGQSFGLQVQRSWNGWPPNFFTWLFFRQAPTHNQQVILWVRPDLFPGGEFEIQNSTLEVAP